MQANSRWIPDLLITCGIVALTCAVYAPALATGFSGDDFLILWRLREFGGLANASVYFTQGFFDYFRPLTFLSHAVDWQLWGMNATGFHLTSVLLHAINAVLVFALARGLTGRVGAFTAAALFAVHPASQETVYWMAARFDLLATAWVLLALVLLTGDGAVRRALGAAAFGAALLSKESALALPLLTAAFDVFVRRFDAGRVIRHLLPLGIVMALYALLRSTADLGVGENLQRLPKLGVLAAAMAALLFVARREKGARDQSPAAGNTSGALALTVIGTACAAVALALAIPETSGWIRQKTGFLAYAAFYLLSPVVFPPISLRFFIPETFADSLPGLAVVAIGAWLLWRARHGLRRRNGAAFALAFVAASLIPVLSLTGSMRYVYLATAGATLLAGLAVGELRGRGRASALAVTCVIGVISVGQIRLAGEAWRWGSAMTARGLALMSASIAPCGTRDVLLLTAPVGIAGVYPNFYTEALALTPCPARSLTALLRVVRTDATVEVRRTGDVVEIQIPEYTGNVVASRDLRRFDTPVPAGARLSLDTTAGALETWSSGQTQIFRWTMAGERRASALFYYSGGALHAAD